MLLNTNNTQINIKCQQYSCSRFRFEKDNTELWLEFQSTQETTEVCCQYCGERSVDIHDNYTTTLIDMPIWTDIRQYITVTYHKYKCRSCSRVFNEDICFKDPDARVTDRAAIWVQALLKYGLCISSVVRLTGINWKAANLIHKRVMDEALTSRKQYLKAIGYKPTYLAVDEFAIHKGQKYATCVMDLDTGEVIWVGKGRATEDFRKFFLEYDMENLSDVKAFAMDMNASYNKLVEEYMPGVDIVYDRYHMQAQFGKEVLGVVRLNEARKHRDNAQDIKEILVGETDPDIRRKWKQEYKEERKKYSDIKNSRWPILTSHSNLNDDKKEALDRILKEHNDIAVCYAMKEELCRLFDLDDPGEAREGWISWFEAAKASRIEPLKHFAELKEPRLEGLIAHSVHHISTGKLEGLNNKIKVAKRVGYGYRDDDYFFTLVRYISIPKNYMLIPQKF
jgi:transposase